MDSDLSQIAAWMQAARIAEIELTSGGKTIRMAITGEAAAPIMTTSTPSRADDSYVTATGIGTLLLAHPLRQGPFVKVGDLVRAGDVVALLQVETGYLPVVAPMDGVIRAISAEAGARLGFGAPIFELV